jgi:hypothetical protein
MPAGQKGLLLHGSARILPQQSTPSLSPSTRCSAALTRHNAAGTSITGACTTFHGCTCMQSTLQLDQGHPVEAHTAPRLQTMASFGTHTMPSTACEPRQPLLMLRLLLLLRQPQHSARHFQAGRLGFHTQKYTNSQGEAPAKRCSHNRRRRASSRHHQQTPGCRRYQHCTPQTAGSGSVVRLLGRRLHTCRGGTQKDKRH